MHIGRPQPADTSEQEPLDPAERLTGIHPPEFSTTQAEMEWRASLQHAIDRQSHDWAVSPRVSFVSPRSKRRLSAGEAVLVGSVEGADFTIGEALILERRGCLLRGTPEGKRAAAGLASDARYLVAPNQAITSREVTLLAGSAVDASMLDDAQVLADLVHKGVVIDRTKPPLSQLPTEVALREREADFERAKAKVQAAIGVLAERDDETSQKAYVDSKLQLDLAGVRVDNARKAIEAEKAAEAQRKRAELARQIDALEVQIKQREAETSKYRVAEVAAARALAAAWRASHEHEDGIFQLRIMQNARFAELHGGEMRQENPPGVRIGQIAGLAKLADVDPRVLNT